jgi:hypothetical protein
VCWRVRHLRDDGVVDFQMGLHSHHLTPGEKSSLKGHPEVGFAEEGRTR